MRIKVKPGVIRDYCELKGISRDELARNMGISTATAYRIDAGKNYPSNEFIAALMAFTCLPFEALFEVERREAA